jgi:crotonobetainyl-CoA:carnitine CoA-transferase CaiB-like acyl-CoA transferase
MLHGANFDKMLEVDPESCAQAFKGSSSVNHAPPMAEDKASTQGPGALAGLKVIDLTRVLGGPYCTMVLSDHGAEVIKLEPPQGDETREWGPPFDDAGDASYFIGINRNKKSVGLDLSKPAGREVLMRLLEDADVLVENFKPGSMEKWALGYEDVLSKRFPRLIHCRVSGFGADGPLGGFPGYDAILQAMVGLMSINGTETSGPTRLGNPIVDIATGLFSAIAILMALHEREKSGKGQFCDMTLHDCGMALLHPHAANFFLNAKRPKATGNPHPNLAPYSKFQTRTCEIFVAAGNDPAFRKFCELLDMPDMASDPRFATNSARLVHRDALTKKLNARFADEDGYELTRRMLAAGLPAGPVLNVDEAMAADHTEHRNMVTEIGAYRGLGTPIKLSRTPGGTRSAPPRFNEHGEAVLRARGFSEAEVAALAREGVLVEKRRK